MLFLSEARMYKIPNCRPVAMLLACCTYALVLSACASTGSSDIAAAEPLETRSEPPDGIEPHVVDYPEPADPLEPVNRAVFAFNDVVYRYLLVPVTRTYVERVPEPARRSIGNAFDNLRMPIDLVNHVARLEWGSAGRDLGRFAINTTVGILGFRDPAAERFGIQGDPTGFADTLSHYGVSHGTYLTLPFVGPSDARSGIGLIADWMVYPFRFATENPTTSVLSSTDFLQRRIGELNSYAELREDSEDPYEFFRDLHVERLARDADYQ